jgi:membrane protease YdiL (CAAX protease family)
VPQHWRLCGTVLWGAVVGATFVSLQVVTILVLGRLPQKGASEGELARFFESTVEDGTLFSVATFVTAAVCCPLVLAIIKLKKHSQVRDYLALHVVPARTALRWFGALAIALAASDLLRFALGRPLVPSSMSAMYATANPAWLFWGALIVAAPLFEELFFRGFLFKGLETSFLGTAGTIIVTSGIWAAIHLQYDAYGIVTVFILGLLLGVARAQGGTLLLPLAMHSAANLAAAVETAALG